MNKKLDELEQLIIGEEGFLIKLRCNNFFDENSYNKIINLLREEVHSWINKEDIPKKGFLLCVELIEQLVGGNRFLSKTDSIKVEDAGIEIKDIINSLY